MATSKGKFSTRPKQVRGIKTRESLLLAAIEVLAEDSLAGLRFSAVAKRAGVPQPLMDYHFPSLESLLTDLIMHQLEKLKAHSVESIQAAAAKPRRALENYVRAPFVVAERDPGFRAVWSAYYHLTTVDKHFAEINHGVRRTGQERIVALLIAILHSENRSSLIKRTKPLNDIATAIQGIMTGYVIMAWSGGIADFKEMADLAVKASAQVLAAGFPE